MKQARWRDETVVAAAAACSWAGSFLTSMMAEPRPSRMILAMAPSRIERTVFAKCAVFFLLQDYRTSTVVGLTPALVVVVAVAALGKPSAQERL